MGGSSVIAVGKIREDVGVSELKKEICVDENVTAGHDQRKSIFLLLFVYITICLH